MTIKEYQAGLKFMLINTIKRLYNGEVIFNHSLDHGIYASIITDVIIDEKELAKIKKYMERLVELDVPFNKRNVAKSDAYKFFDNKGEVEKSYNISTISNLTVSLFELEGQYNYLYTHDMPKSTGELKDFDLYYISPNEIVLIYPFNGKIDFNFRNNIYKCFRTANDFFEKMDVNYVMDVNNKLVDGTIKEFVTKNDLLVDFEFKDVAELVMESKKKIVLLAGPSSSGKTTTSRKLSLFLDTMGNHAIPISLDDFFKNRVDTPLDEFGNKDYESINALDLDLFNEVLEKLLNGEKVKLPVYDFISGEKHFTDKEYQITEDDILVIEGLHGLNPNLLKDELKDKTYKIYVSPLTPLNVDRHNYVSTTDNRLLRRMIRDFRTRGRSAEDTINSWPSVRDGEEKYIFPYTDNADIVINTAYVYELGVLKVFVEPLLRNILPDSPAYGEARRLMDSLRVIYPISSEYIKNDVVLREFIGGSVFEEER